MTYTAWVKQRSCDGKIPYRTQLLAMHAAVRSAYAYGDPLTDWDYYKCRFGAHWHTGHKAVHRV